MPYFDLDSPPRKGALKKLVCSQEIVKYNSSSYFFCLFLTDSCSKICATIHFQYWSSTKRICQSPIPHLTDSQHTSIIFLFIHISLEQENKVPLVTPTPSELSPGSGSDATRADLVILSMMNFCTTTFWIKMKLI